MRRPGLAEPVALSALAALTIAVVLLGGLRVFVGVTWPLLAVAYCWMWWLRDQIAREQLAAVERRLAAARGERTVDGEQP